MTAPHQFGLARVAAALNQQPMSAKQQQQQQQQQLKRIKSAPELSEAFGSMRLCPAEADGTKGANRRQGVEQQMGWLPLATRTEGLELQVSLQ